jgi:hypothetical protein
MTCHGLNCTNTKLIRAHIIPAGFGRLINISQKPLLKFVADRVGEAIPQLEYDPNILCEDCDNILGKTDEYALDVAKKFKAQKANAEGNLFEIEKVDCDRFTKFVLSVIWRASISDRGDSYSRSRFWFTCSYGCSGVRSARIKIEEPRRVRRWNYYLPSTNKI